MWYVRENWFFIGKEFILNHEADKGIMEEAYGDVGGGLYAFKVFVVGEDVSFDLKSETWLPEGGIVILHDLYLVSVWSEVLLGKRAFEKGLEIGRAARV